MDAKIEIMITTRSIYDLDTIGLSRKFGWSLEKTEAWIFKQFVELLANKPDIHNTIEELRDWINSYDRGLAAYEIVKYGLSGRHERYIELASPIISAWSNFCRWGSENGTIIDLAKAIEGDLIAHLASPFLSDELSKLTGLNSATAKTPLSAAQYRERYKSLSYQLVSSSAKEKNWLKHATNRLLSEIGSAKESQGAYQLILSKVYHHRSNNRLYKEAQKAVIDHWVSLCRPISGNLQDLMDLARNTCNDSYFIDYVGEIIKEMFDDEVKRCQTAPKSLESAQDFGSLQNFCFLLSAYYSNNDNDSKEPFISQRLAYWQNYWNGCKILIEHLLADTVAKIKEESNTGTSLESELLSPDSAYLDRSEKIISDLNSVIEQIKNNPKEVINFIKHCPDELEDKAFLYLMPHFTKEGLGDKRLDKMPNGFSIRERLYKIYGKCVWGSLRSKTFRFLADFGHSYYKTDWKKIPKDIRRSFGNRSSGNPYTVAYRNALEIKGLSYCEGLVKLSNGKVREHSFNVYGNQVLDPFLGRYENTEIVEYYGIIIPTKTAKGLPIKRRDLKLMDRFRSLEEKLGSEMSEIGLS
jgi:hypothetical protein